MVSKWGMFEKEVPGRDQVTMKSLAATNTAGKRSGGERRQKRVRDNSGWSVCPHSVCVCLLCSVCVVKSSEFLSHH